MEMVKEIMHRESIAPFHDQLISHPSVLESYCQFLARLLQHDTATLELPYCWKPEQKSSIEKLLEAVGSKNCLSVRLINTKNVNFEIEEFLYENFFFVDVFFRPLPQLANLQVINLHCKIHMEDSDLEEFAQYTRNLV